MALQDDIFDAHGGIDRWRARRCFTVYFSIDGSVLAERGRRGALKELAAQGSTQTPSLQITGFPAPDRRGVYRPDRVAIETLDAATVATRDDPRSVLRGRVDGAWDDLDLAYFCGMLIWNCLAGPFLLAQPDVKVQEIAPRQELGETWQRLKAVYPAAAGTLAREQIFCFDQRGFQRRTDYRTPDAENTLVAQYSWAHQVFSGILVPTLHRSLTLRTEGTVVRSPPRLDIEIFDVMFE